MTERRNQARGASEWADTYGAIGLAAPMQLTQLPVNILDPWEDTSGEAQPFKPYSQDKLDELAENIRKNGVIEAICVRPLPGGRFQIIAGHNRVAASRMAGLTTIPAIVQQLNDDEATIRMVDSNLQHREKLLPSEKAFAYKLRFESVKRQRNSTNTEGAPVEHLPSGVKSRDILAAESGESHEQIRRYIRLTELLPELLELVDNEKFAFRAAVEVSYLSKEAQALLLQVMADAKCKAPSMAQAAKLRTAHKAAVLEENTVLSRSTILSILCPRKEPKAATVKLPADRIISFFPEKTTPEAMEAEIYEALAFYRKHKAPASA